MNEKNRFQDFGDVSRKEIDEILQYAKSALDITVSSLQKVVGASTDRFHDASEKPKEIFESGRNIADGFASTARDLGSTAFSKFVRDPRKSKELGDRLPDDEE